MEIRSPANGQVVGAVPSASLKEVDWAVKVAQETFWGWAARTAYDREKIIRKATAHVRTKADEIGLLMAQEQGKPLKQCISEVIGSCDTIDYYAAEAPRIEGYTNPTEDPNFRSWVIYQPVGVCALITPWNYPLSLLSWKLGPALAAGCTVVVKPTEVTPLSPLAFCHALHEGGIPAGVINTITGEVSVAEQLLAHPGIAKVAMTGSTATGKRIMESFGPSLRRVSLELGGHCPAIVCEDADLELAAKVIAYKGFRNNGQSCSTVNRVYAHASVHDQLVTLLKAQAEKLRIGDPVAIPDSDLGPMTTASVREKVVAHVTDAIEKGANLICGGSPPDGPEYAEGYYYRPTILTNVTPDMRMMQEETFGPVVPFAEPFNTIEDGIERANNSAYGLVAYLFTRNLTTTMRVSEALEVGTVCVNNGAVNTNYGPYEGWKDSGFGLELSRRAIYEYLHTKHIKVQLG